MPLARGTTAPESGTVWPVIGNGNLYGMTSGGGEYGYGTVFKVSHELSGRWSETVLESFKAWGPKGSRA
jgi:uncharacterized repeat protein (TIGR03803 family)